MGTQKKRDYLCPPGAFGLLEVTKHLEKKGKIASDDEKGQDGCFLAR